MGSRQTWGIGIGAAIGAVLVAVSFDYLALGPGALGAGIGALVGALVGSALGRRIGPQTPAGGTKQTPEAAVGPIHKPPRRGVFSETQRV